MNEQETPSLWEEETVEADASEVETSEEKPEPLAKVAKEEPPKPAPRLPEPTPGAAPPWAIIPEGLRAPRGRTVFFSRFPASWTDTPREGIPGELSEPEKAAWTMAGQELPTLFRQCIFWALSIGDQTIALSKANGDMNRFNTELAKQMVRAVDGFLVSRDGMGGPGDIDLWWNRIGERCRSELTRFCTRIHSLTPQERALFFEHCVAARTPG